VSRKHGAGRSRRPPSMFMRRTAKLNVRPRISSGSAAFFMSTGMLGSSRWRRKARCSPPREQPNKRAGGWCARDRARANTRVLEHLGQSAQILGTNFPRAVIHNDLEIDLLPYFQIHHSSALDSADVDVDVESAVTWLEETVALPGVEPYYGSSLHRHLTVTADKHGQGEGITFSVFQSSIADTPRVHRANRLSCG
jgi:hypothetical protein